MIVKLNKSHLDDVLLIENECFSHPKSKETIKEELNNENYIFLGYSVNQKIVAYINYYKVLDEINIGNIAVLNDFRKQGIATELLNKVFLENKNSTVFLEVRESNLPAINLYKSLNFEQISIRKNYYKNPVENAVIFKKE